MTERKTKSESRSGKPGEGVPKGQGKERAPRVPELGKNDRDSRQGVLPTDESQHKGGARDAMSTGGQQQGGPGSPLFPRFDRANDGGSAKNRR